MEFKLDVPIIQGGMGVGVSLSNLAGNVMKCGGMGTISAAHPGYKEPDFYTNSKEANCRAIHEEAKKAREIAQGKGMLAINIMVASKDYASYVKASIEAKYDAIISGAGLAISLPEYVGNTDILLAPIVSSGKALQLICRSWVKRYKRLPDFVVIESALAGGHLGFKEKELQSATYQSLDEILLEVKDYVSTLDKDIPIFVAGGVFTHEDLVHYQKLGATGAQIGTRFIATYECDAAQGFKDMVINARKEDIQLVKSPAGLPARAIRNAFVERSEAGSIPVQRCVGCLKTCNPSTTPYCITNALIQAVKGNQEDGLFFVGQNASRVNKMCSVKELVEELCQ